MIIINIIKIIYNIISFQGSNMSESSFGPVYVVCALATILLLYGYCIVGECLIDEAIKYMYLLRNYLIIILLYINGNLLYDLEQSCSYSILSMHVVRIINKFS